MGQERAGRSTYASHNPPMDVIGTRVFAAIVVLLVGAAVVVLAWNWWTVPVARAFGLAEVLFLGSVELASIGWSLYAWNSVGPRTWEWDADGIAFQGAWGRRHLLWGDVERIRWRPFNGVTVAGRGGRIELRWADLKPDRRAEARDELLRILKADFDIPVPAPRGETHPFPWLLIAELFAGLAWVGLSAAIAMRAAYRAAEAIAPLAWEIVRDKKLLLVVLFCTWGLGSCLIAFGLIYPLMVRWGFGRYDRWLARVREHRDPL